LNLSEEQIFTLAPGESSKKSGKVLANPSNWVSKGANQQAQTRHGLPAGNGWLTFLSLSKVLLIIRTSERSAVQFVGGCAGGDVL
jgi:hypothetical protein